MSKITTKRIRNWVSLGMLVIFVTSLTAWFLGRDRLPRTIRIATGDQGGLYHKIGNDLEPFLASKTGRSVIVTSTPGSQDNYARLAEKRAELGIVQAGSVPVENLAIVTPLFPEFLFVIVRRESHITAIRELAGRNIALGPSGSGTRQSALHVLKHFDIAASDLGSNDNYFMNLLDDRSLDGALVTTGIENPDLATLMSTNKFDFLPILNAAAIEMEHPFLRQVEMPRGLYGETEPLPPQAIPTIATTAYLVCRYDASDRLVRASLEAVHEESLRLKVPTLIPRDSATTWVSTRLHPVAHDYFNPADNIGWIKNIMESINATKELLVALGTGFYLLWLRWRRLKEQEADELLRQQMDRLNWFLQETLRVEKLQMGTTDVSKLETFLDEVTQIKLQALGELTEEDLRGNQAFSIFLDQCAGLRNKIQLKILSRQQARSS
ncbi:MAG: TAXI family TRAP transporter solute-binding subunit [Pirellulaceae bacterium]